MSKFPLYKAPSKSRAGVQYTGHDLRGTPKRLVPSYDGRKAGRKSRRLRRHRWVEA